jgi:hypothetical protein
MLKEYAAVAEVCGQERTDYLNFLLRDLCTTCSQFLRFDPIDSYIFTVLYQNNYP